MMQTLIEGLRKIVVFVLLMELVLQMQQGKQYEPFVKVLIGIMVVYSVAGWFLGMESAADLQIWDNDWYDTFIRQSETILEQNDSDIEDMRTENAEITIPKIPEICVDNIEPISNIR